MGKGPLPFSIVDNHLFYKGLPIPQVLLEDAQRVNKGHVVPRLDERMAVLSFVYAIVNRNEAYEKAVKYLSSVTSWPTERLFDADEIFEQTQRLGMQHRKYNIFEEPFKYAHKYPGGIEALAQNYLAQPEEGRRELIHVKDIKSKTASLWHLCLGGRTFMTLDRHNFRALAGIGLDIPERLLSSPPRKSGMTKGKRIPTQPGTKKYLAIEQEAIARFRPVVECADEQGFNPSLPTSIFYMMGIYERLAKKGRDQGNLFTPWEDRVSAPRYE